MRTYSELSKIKSFEDRFRYLQLNGKVGVETFGFDRFMNQAFYQSVEWKRIRDIVIMRDNGCDLGVNGHEIYGRITIHHMNPVLPRDIESHSDLLMNPEYLICTTHNTHNAIHFSNESLLPKDPIERKPNDTCPWKK